MRPTEEAFALLTRWLARGDRDDLLVALDALQEANLPFIFGERRREMLAEILAKKRTSREARSVVLAHMVWDLVQQQIQWQPSDGEMRALLALALHVRQVVGRGNRSAYKIVGGRRGFINIAGLLRWAGVAADPDGFYPRIVAIRRFVEGGDAERLKMDLRHQWRRHDYPTRHSTR